jgi:lipoprotein-anchoring transpeptidase ErfK/SrfK
MPSLLAAVVAFALTPQAPSARQRSPLSPRETHALTLQVTLDRAGFSPGEIDARLGVNTLHASDAFRRAGGNPDAQTVAPTTRYTITNEDAAGPFTPAIPKELPEQAHLDALDYRDIVEALGEKFHVSPALLKRMNPGAAFKAGGEITVPNVADAVQPVGPPRGGRPAPDPAQPANTLVTVSKAESALTITDGEGHVLFYAPVTTGSEHDPLPIGNWTVTGVQRNPKFHYNPELFWDAEPSHSKATIPPGPNNPVGVVWIDISKPHYGIHGTPEPGAIGHTESHGCVRLTNWDALKAASLVRPGTRVVFKE